VAPPQCTAPAVVTSSGTACGLTETGRGPDGLARPVRAYLGIRYATAGRWERPRPVRTDAPVRATVPGDTCPQSTKWQPADLQSEDCLFINVWTPAGGGRGRLRPVMVFLHGGAFVLGSGSNPVYDGRNLAARGDVVLVSLNYRLGALGFLAGGDGEDQLEGNYGLRDQQVALQWVQTNIRAFGGDPDAVTVFGESAGAMSVGAHLVAPTSQALFRAAIMESNPYGIPFKSAGESRVVRRSFDLASERCLTGALTCLRALPFGRVVEIEASAVASAIPLLLEGLAGLLTWTPVVDGELLPIQPSAAAVRKPVIAGTNTDEGPLFAGGFRSLPDWEYHLALRFLFGGGAPDQILARARYAGGEGQDVEALGRVIGDALFTCANRRVLGNARVSDAFGYEFALLPSYAVWPPGWPMAAACQPARGKVCHTFELPFVFGNAVAVLPAPPGTVLPETRFTPAEQKLSGLMTDYWAAFAHRARPDGPGLPDWPPFGDGVRLVFGRDLSRTRDDAAHCDMWNGLAVGRDR